MSFNVLVGPSYILFRKMLPPVFVNTVLLKHSCVHLFIYCPRATYALEQSWVVVTETLWPTKPNIFTTGPLQKTFADFWDRSLGQKIIQCFYCTILKVHGSFSGLFNFITKKTWSSRNQAQKRGCLNCNLKVKGSGQPDLWYFVWTNDYCT